jgi:hypothetical protein
MDLTYVPLFQLLVTGAVGFGAVVMAAFAISANREIARNRATLDYIERYESTDFYQKISEAFHSIRRRPNGFDDLFVPQTDDNKKLRYSVIQYLNHYENISIGIQFGTLSEEIYYRAFRGAVVADWELAWPFVKNLRDGIPGGRPPSPRAFVELQWLAERWKDTKPIQGHVDVRRNRLTLEYAERADIH